MNEKLLDELLRTYRQGFKLVLQTRERLKRVNQTLREIDSKGLILSVLSNERKEYLKKGLQFAGLLSLFDFVLSSEEIGYEKPDVRFFEIPLTQYNLKPRDTLYVGDDLFRDIYPASRVGLKTALILRPLRESKPWRSYQDQSQVKPDFRISEIHELVHLINKQQSD